jgi:histidine ammonia-lyase
MTGTQMMASIAAEAVTRARNLAITADIACAMSVEALRGNYTQVEEGSGKHRTSYI